MLDACFTERERTKNQNCFCGLRCPQRQGRLHLDHRPHRRPGQRVRSPPVHSRSGVGADWTQSSGWGCVCVTSTQHQGGVHLLLRHAQTGASISPGGSWLSPRKGWPWLEKKHPQDHTQSRWKEKKTVCVWLGEGVYCCFWRWHWRKFWEHKAVGGAEHAETFLNLKVNCMVGADLQVCTWIWQKHCWGTVRLQAAKAFSCCTSSSAVEVPSVAWKSGVSSEGASDLEVLQFGRFRLTLCVLTLWILFYITFQASSPLEGCMITEYVSPWYNHNGLTGCKTPTYLLSFSPWRPVYVSLFHLFISVFICVSAFMYECMYLCVCVCVHRIESTDKILRFTNTFIMIFWLLSE